MSGTPAEMLGILRDYGLAGMLAWLFWWTLRRMMASHDATVRGLKEQSASQVEAARETSDRFSGVVENHMAHVGDCLARFETSLGHHLESQPQMSNLLLEVLNRMNDRLGREMGV